MQGVVDKGRCAPLLATAANFTNIHTCLVAHSCAINSFGTISFTEFQSLQLCKLMGPIPIYTICIYKHVLPSPCKGALKQMYKYLF